MAKTYYLVHHPDGDRNITPRRFESFAGARLHAFLLSRITGRGISVTRHPVPYSVARVFVSTAGGGKVSL